MIVGKFGKIPLALAILLTLGGCTVTDLFTYTPDLGPYYPEPFGNHSYARDSFPYCEQRKGAPYESAGEVKFSPWMKGAVGFRPNPIIDICTINRYKKVQDHYLNLFSDMAYRLRERDRNLIETKISTGKASASERGIYWREVSKNGMNYIDGVCHDYLRQLYRLKKNTKGLKKLTVNAGYTTAQIVGNTMTRSTEAGRILAVIGAAFGLGTTMFDIYEDSILIQSDYSAVYRMVRLLRSHIRSSLDTAVSERADAVKVLQSYLFVCTPQAIEASINTKIGAESDREVLIALGIEDVPSAEEKNLIALTSAIISGGDMVRTNVDPSTGTVTFTKVDKK